MKDTFLSHSPGHSWFHLPLPSAVPVVSFPAEHSQPIRSFFILKAFHSFDHPCWSPAHLSGPTLFFLGAASSPACSGEEGTHYRCARNTGWGQASFCFLSSCPNNPWCTVFHTECWWTLSDVLNSTVMAACLSRVVVANVMSATV